MVTLDCARSEAIIPTVLGTPLDAAVRWVFTPTSSLAALTYATTLRATVNAGLTAGPTRFGSWTINKLGIGPNIGVIAPADGPSVVDQAQNFVTTCSHPSGWRSVRRIDLKLAIGPAAPETAAPAVWLQYDQGADLICFFDPDCGTWASGTPGSDAVLSNRYADVSLAETKVRGFGPTDPAVEITWPVCFHEPARGLDLRQVPRIEDDEGQVTRWDQVGLWQVFPEGYALIPFVGRSSVSGW